MFLRLVKKLLYTSSLLCCPMCRALYKRGFEPPTSQSISKEKSRNIANIGMQSYITKFSQKCCILSVYCTVLCTERFELPHSWSTSKKKLGHITNINIWSYNLKFSQKTMSVWEYSLMLIVIFYFQKVWLLGNCNTQKPYFLKIKKFSFFKNIFILKSRFNFKMYGFLLLLFISKSFSLVTPFHVDNQIAVIFVKAVSLHFIQEVRIMPFLQNLYLLFYSETPANVPFRQFLSSYLGWVLQHAFHFFQ